MHTDPLQEIAKKEASAQHYAQFAPITRGPLFALVQLLWLGCIALPILIYRKLLRP